jgi:antitoxin YefM
MNLSASEARAKLFPLIEELNAGGDPVLISSKAGNAVLLSESEYNGRPAIF